MSTLSCFAVAVSGTPNDLRRSALLRRKSIQTIYENSVCVLRATFYNFSRPSSYIDV